MPPHQVVVDSWDKALEGVKAGQSIAFGGFGLSGVPIDAIHQIRRRRSLKDITAVSTESGISDFGLGLLIESGQIRRQM